MVWSFEGAAWRAAEAWARMARKECFSSVAMLGRSLCRSQSVQLAPHAPHLLGVLGQTLVDKVHELR
jgi:hypothetical protein